MSEVINSIFGRSQNDTTRHGGFVPTSTTHTAAAGFSTESGDTTGIAIDETVEPAGETAVDAAGDTDLATGIADEDETTGTLTDETDTDEGDAADTADTAEGDAADTAETDTEDIDEATDGAATDDSAELGDEGSELAEEPESDEDSGDRAESSVSIGDASEQGPENIGDAGEQGPQNIDDAAEVAEETEITDEAEPANETAETGDEPVAEAVETADDEPVAEATESGDEPVAEAVEADDAPAAVVAETDEDEAETVPGARAAAATRGDTTVDDGVVAKVVDMLVRKVEGVHSLEDTNISVDGDVVTIKVSVVLEFGHAVKAVAGQIRTSVIDAVEELLGLDVAAVDVRITDVYLSDAS